MLCCALDIYPRYCLRVRVEVDGVVLLPLDEVPPGLDVGDLHGVTDRLDVGAGGPRLRTEESGDPAP